MEYGNINLIAKEVCYHSKCKSDYKQNQKGEPMDPPKLDVVYSQFYDEIETQVIVNLKLVNTETAYHVFKECKPAIPTR